MRSSAGVTRGLVERLCYYSLRGSIGRRSNLGKSSVGIEFITKTTPRRALSEKTPFENQYTKQNKTKYGNRELPIPTSSPTHTPHSFKKYSHQLK